LRHPFIGLSPKEPFVMATTVYFATNRVVSDSSDPINGYPANMVKPSMPNEITYGVAFVDGVDIAAGIQGAITQIGETNKSGLSPEAISDLSDPGRDLLVFIHGFDNTFSDAITRAAFNREWLSAANIAVADTTVLAFSWPSKGELISFPILDGDYLFDERMARQSGPHLVAFFANLGPVLSAARARGRRVTLLAHSMGNLALDAAVESWFMNGNGDNMMFDLTILAAGDCRYDTFDQPSLAHLGGLTRLTKRVMVCYSQTDQVLQLSMVVNLGARRLGQSGPRNRSDSTTFPLAQYQMMDCSQFRDYDFNPLTSHQYYRMSPDVRALIVTGMGGGTAMV
jgi:esterase/lipase superfamily enzyme